jgi:hypothetical protein
MREERSAYRVSVWKRKGKRLLRRSECRQEDNIKLDLKEIGCEGVDLMFWSRIYRSGILLTS